MAPYCEMDETGLSMLEDILQNDEIINPCIVLIILIRLQKLKCIGNVHFKKAYKSLQRMPIQVKHMTRLVGMIDYDCLATLRMDHNTFGSFVVYSDSWVLYGINGTCALKSRWPCS